MTPLSECFEGRSVFVTGHTGFKGAWLSQWLANLGAEVTGYALDPPTNPSLFDALDLPSRLAFRIADLARAAERSGDGGAIHDGEVRLDWPWTQAELAGMVGGSRESVNRLLADFVARGLIRFEQDTLVVPDTARLIREARR